MAAITSSAPIVAKAPVALARRTRVTARAATVAPAAGASSVSFGARKMMSGARIEASRISQPTNSGRKSLIWCVRDHNPINKSQILGPDIVQHH